MSRNSGLVPCSKHKEEQECVTSVSDRVRIQYYLDVEAALAKAQAKLRIIPQIAEVGTYLGLVAGSLAKISMDVKLMMSTEVGEVSEPFMEGRGSSSTMPQKRNPISCNFIHACAAGVKQQAAALLDAMVADHERSTGPWEIEWIAVPEIFLLTAGALRQASFMLSGLEVHEEKMRRNLHLTNGLVCTEAVMMALAKKIGREKAHDLIYDICRQVSTGKKSLFDLLRENKEVSQHLSDDQLKQLLDPEQYTGLASVMVENLLKKYYSFISNW